MGGAPGLGAAFRRLASDRNLTLVQTGSVLAWTGEWAFTTALAIYAFDVGGAAGVGLVGLLRMLPAAVAAPVAATLLDRLPRDAVLVRACATRAALTVAAAALVLTGAPAAGVFALATLGTIAFTLVRPAMSSLLPALCRRPEDLTSSNVVNSMLEGGSTLLGPVIAGLLVATTSVEVALAAAGVLFAGAGSAFALLRYERTARAAPVAGRAIAHALEGFRALRREPDVRLVVLLGAAQAAVRGALNVFIVVLALQTLDLGEAGVGTLTAAVGAGGLLAGVAAMALASGAGLARNFALGLVLWGAPIAVLGLWPATGTAIAALTLVGVGNTFVDVAAITLLNRTTDDAVLGRVFGVLESLIMLAVGLGSIVTPLLIGLLGVQGALGVVGVTLPLAALLAWPRLDALAATIAGRDADIGLLRGVPALAPLPLTAIEPLARGAGRAAVPAGTAVFAQGDQGDRFYVIATGRAEVLRDGLPLRELEAGGCFGEIALLRDVPRTATVRATEDLQLLTLERTRFVATVTGFSASAQAAEDTVGSLLAEHRPGIAAL